MIEVLFVIGAAALGAVAARVLTYAAQQLLAHKPLFSGLSLFLPCNECNHVLSGIGALPLIGLLIVKGHCKACGARFPIVHLAGETFLALAFASIVAVWGISWTTLEFLFLMSTLFLAAVCDINSYTIPNGVVLFGVAAWATLQTTAIVLGVVPSLSAFSSGLASALVASLPALIVAIVMGRIQNMTVFGGGDIKLLFMAGLYFPWQEVITALILSCVAGIVIGLVGQSRLKKSEKDNATVLLPFGVAIAIGFWLTMLFGPQILMWYVTLF